MTIVNKKRQVDEIRRCGRDPIYFFNTYVKVSHPMRGSVLFETYPFQDDCVHAFLEHRFVIVNKARQLGLSTLAAAYAAWLLLFHRNKEIIIMATKLKVATNFIRKVKHVIKSLPRWLILPKIEKDNEQSLVFGSPSNSRIEAIPTSDDAGRSEALSLLIVDEAAHVANFKELWTGLYPTLSTGGRALIMSTPKGVGNQFHTLWREAVEGSNGFHHIELPWYVHPEHDQAWFDNETKNMSKKAIAQEQLCDFLSSGDTYLDADDIAWVGQNIRQPIRREGPDRNVWIWFDPIRDPDVKYIIPADVGRGDSNDFSAFHVICTTTGEVVAEYKGKLRPDLFATLLHEYAKRYGNALLAPERNTYGHHTIVHLITQLGYTNIYFKDKKGVFIGEYIPPEKIADAGFDTQKHSRERIIAKFEEVIRNRQIMVFSQRLYDELKTFVTLNDKPQAQKNCHDDLILSLAIGIYLFDTSDVYSQFASQLSTAMLNCFSMSSNEYENMYGNGNDVLPSWSGLIPYAGGTSHTKTRLSRNKKTTEINDISWLFR